MDTAYKTLYMLILNEESTLLTFFYKLDKKALHYLVSSLEYHKASK